MTVKEFFSKLKTNESISEEKRMNLSLRRLIDLDSHCYINRLTFLAYGGNKLELDLEESMLHYDIGHFQQWLFNQIELHRSLADNVSSLAFTLENQKK